MASQKAEGWVCLADRYDDGRYTGANMERPGLKRLLDDINADRIDCVAVYKVDRISRSLLYFARMMETFEKHQVSDFVNAPSFAMVRRYASCYKVPLFCAVGRSLWF